jgi:hypothetical protein
MLISWALAAVVEVRSMRARRKRGLPDLATIALLAQGLGFGLFSQRGFISDWLSVYAANILIVGAIALFYLGIEHLHGDSGFVLVAILPPGTIALLYPIIGLTDATLVERVVVGATACCAAYATVMVAALRAYEPGRRLGALMVVAGMLAVTGAQAIRALAMIDQSRGDLFAPQAPQIVFSAAILAGFVVTVLGYIAMQGGGGAARDLPA